MNAANRIEYSGNSTDTGFFTALRITIMSFSIFFANFLIIFFLIFPVCRAEKLILEEVQKKAVDSSPLKKQLLYYQTMSALEQSNLNSNYLPQLSLDGQATYQSDVFKLPFTLPQGFPSINIPEVRKDQYKVSLGINQMIYDGGIVSGMKDSKSLEYETSARTVDINLFKINEIINQLFFSALILQENKDILTTLAEELKKNRNQLQVRVDNGVLPKSTLDRIDIEILKTGQNLDAVNIDRKAVLDMLAKWLDSGVDWNPELVKPEAREDIFNINKNQRPEFKLFETKKLLLEAGKAIAYSAITPKFFSFVQLGYGNPNPLNFFENDWKFYYYAGLKMQWNIWDWNSAGRKSEIIDIGKNIVQTESDNFDKSIGISLTKDSSDIMKYQNLLPSDEEMIRLQTKITEEKYLQLQNGVVTASEYTTELNILAQLKMNLEIHKIQYIYSQYSYLNKAGY